MRLGGYANGVPGAQYEPARVIDGGRRARVANGPFPHGGRAAATVDENTPSPATYDVGTTLGRHTLSKPGGAPRCAAFPSFVFFGVLLTRLCRARDGVQCSADGRRGLLLLGQTIPSGRRHWRTDGMVEEARLRSAVRWFARRSG